MKPGKTLYYVHDPMCSWCWGFRPTWLAVQKQLPPGIRLVSLLGGLAPDSDLPMPPDMQKMIARIWSTIQKQIPGTPFNFDFWTSTLPRRSTYPACRAVIAARKQRASHEEAMTLAIQEAYYLNAQNPSVNSVLIDLAKTLSLDVNIFTKDLFDPGTQRQLANEIHLSRSLGAKGFPSLILVTDTSRSLLHIDYNQPEVILEQLS